MEEVLDRAYEIGFGTVLFALGVIYVMYHYNVLNGLTKELKEYSYRDNVIMQDAVDETALESYNELTRSEVISSLMQEVSYDVNIAGTLITKDKYNFSTIDFSTIPSGIYERKVKYDDNGMIRVVYYILK